MMAAGLVSPSARVADAAGPSPVAGLLRRKCACGGSHREDECERCKKVRRSPLVSAPLLGDAPVPPLVHATLGEPGLPLDAAVRRPMESGFGCDFSRVRVHATDDASASAAAIGATAYSVGEHIAFGAGQFAPYTPAGRRLLAHELAHVAESRTSVAPAAALAFGESDASERAADAAADRIVSGATGLSAPPAPTGRAAVRRTRVGTKFTSPPGTKPTAAKLKASFDGEDFTLEGDTVPAAGHKTFVKASAQSGRPVAVDPATAAKCGGKSSDCYMNDPRYVGITDFGVIPEGTFTFNPTELATFSTADQYRILGGGMWEDPFGTPLHGGDWGAGRAPLHPVRLVAAAPGCGNTSARSGFFLHGGKLAGSSGCIDIGDSGIADLTRVLPGYTAPIPVTVAYKASLKTSPPGCSLTTRVSGGVTYPQGAGQHQDPGVVDRLRGGAREAGKWYDEKVEAAKKWWKDW